ncbi:MAG TPA: glycosyltransferase family 2 protein [Alphaproteobacteria bacterium]|nr:glycosyltransferase family 2 protein [Alphaproteobacteria bacterium]
MKPLVSILIPAYKAEPWISDAIKSALRQTWPRKEIIVVDDGSTDGTLAVASQFSGEGVTVVSQKNRGASAARNHAYSLCSGHYIQWLDADDILAPDKISRQIEVAQTLKNPRLLLSSEWGRFHYRTKVAQFIPTALWQDLPPVEWLLRKMTFNVWMQPGSWLVSRELMESAGPWDERLSFDDDGEYFCRIISKSQGVPFVRGAKTFYRLTPESLSTVDNSNKKRESAWLSIRLQIQYLLQLEDSERSRAAAVTFLQTWFTMFDPYRMDIIEQMQEFAQKLGGVVRRLHPVEALRWKWAWMEGIFGSRAAHWAQKSLPKFKYDAICAARLFWERTLYQLGYE